MTSSARPATHSRETGRIGRLLAIGLPAASMLAVIAIVATDLPFADGWDTPGSLLEAETHRDLGPGDFFAQHNESRPVFPRLLFYAMSHTLGWHPKHFMLLSWLATLVTALLAARWLAQTARKPLALIATLIVSTFLFSLAQYANFLWGIQFVVFLPSLCLVLAIELARSRAPPTWILGGVLGLCFLSTFSYANGMLLWLVAAPLPLLSMARRVQDRSRLRALFGMYLACGAGTLLLYFSDYARPADHSSLAAGLDDPATTYRFFASWLGAPFSDVAWPLSAASGAGTVILIMAVVLVAGIGRQAMQTRDPDLIDAALPWLVLLAYGLISGLITTAGRVGAGNDGAFAQRYAAQVLWIPVGMTGLACVLRSFDGSSRLHLRTLIEWALLAVLGVLAALSWLNGAGQLEQYSKQLRQNALSLRLSTVLPNNPLLARIHPDPERVVRRIRLLNERGLLETRPIGSWITSTEPRPVLALGNVRVWPLPQQGETAPRLLVDGRAVIPDTQRAADAVLLRWTTPRGRARDWTALIVADRDAAGGERIGFLDILDAPLAVDPAKLEALAVDLTRQRLYRIPRGAR